MTGSLLCHGSWRDGGQAGKFGQSPVRIRAGYNGSCFNIGMTDEGGEHGFGLVVLQGTHGRMTAFASLLPYENYNKDSHF